MYFFGVFTTALQNVWSLKLSNMRTLHHCKVKVGCVLPSNKKAWFISLMSWKQARVCCRIDCIEAPATLLNEPERIQTV